MAEKYTRYTVVNQTYGFLGDKEGYEYYYRYKDITEFSGWCKASAGVMLSTLPSAADSNVVVCYQVYDAVGGLQGDAVGRCFLISCNGTTYLTVSSYGDGVTPVYNTDYENETEEGEGQEITEEEPTYMDENFAIQYSAFKSEDDYYAYLDSLSNGLDIKDLIGILGIPHQFLPITDPRYTVDSNGIDNDSYLSAIGRTYTQNIIKRMPMLLITPGVPSFKSEFSNTGISMITDALSGGNVLDSDLQTLFDGSNGRYYTLRFAYENYFYYVNAMLRSAAYYLGIEDVEYNGRTLGRFNWLYYLNANDDTSATIFGRWKSVFSGNTDLYSNNSIYAITGTYAGCIPFYVDPGYTVDDSFGNQTTTSQLASAMNSLSDQGRELNFIVGNAGSLTGIGIVEDASTGAFHDMLENLTNSINTAFGNTHNVFTNILNKCNTLLAGGRLVFPEIWQDSSFSRSYSCSMKLVAGSGAKLSVFFDILVPFYHLLAMSTPRQSTGQAYYSPFLVRCFCQGAFNVDMGIITSLNITKGAEAEWTVDGLPTVANITFDIKDLYEGFFISPQNSVGTGVFSGFFNSTEDNQSATDVGILANIAELDYIANSCGVNVNDQEIWRTIKMSSMLALGTSFMDWVEIGIFGKLNSWFNQKINNIFGVF